MYHADIPYQSLIVQFHTLTKTYTGKILRSLSLFIHSPFWGVKAVYSILLQMYMAKYQ